MRMPATIVVMMHSPSESKCSQPISEILLSPLARAAASRPGARFLEALPVFLCPERIVVSALPGTQVCCCIPSPCMYGWRIPS